MNLRNRRSRPTAEVHTAALNDIMFFLMLFFLLASAVSNPQVVKLLLPKTSAGEQSVAKKTITVSVTKDLIYYVDKEPVPLEALEQAIQSRMVAGEEVTVILYADGAVQLQNAMDIMTIANKLKIKLVLATEKQKED